MVAPDRPVELVVDDPAAAVVVTGDELRLRQVLGNIVGNALTHTPAGTPITVQVQAADGWAELDVIDRGPGLPAEQAERVFERFYRADPSRTRAHGGTGLGLSIVAGLVSAHGGTVALDTAPGEGATFRIRLPLATDAATDKHRVETDATPA
jgi:two-component system OmpR family sensor kinase